MDMRKKEAFEILGLPENSDDDTIKKAYRKLALKNHPDKGGDPEKVSERESTFFKIKMMVLLIGLDGACFYSLFLHYLVQRNDPCVRDPVRQGEEGGL